MPFPLIPAIAAGAQLLGSGINAVSTANQNRRSREWAERMYQQQYQDNIAFWNMQNAYNSPQQQMNRFQEAGLNPNLIYGQGNSGPAGAISTPDIQQPEFRAPEWGGGLETAPLAYMNAIYDLEIKQAQTDNLKAQNTVILQDALLKKAQTESTVTGRTRAEFDLGLESELRPYSLEARREGVRQLKTNIDLSIRRDAREAALNSSSVQEAAERMLSMQEQRANTRLERQRIRENIQLMRQDQVLKGLEIDLRKQGINPQDPMWARIVGRMLSDYFNADGTSKTPQKSIWQRLFGQ